MTKGQFREDQNLLNSLISIRVIINHIIRMTSRALHKLKSTILRLLVKSRVPMGRSKAVGKLLPYRRETIIRFIC